MPSWGVLLVVVFLYLGLRGTSKKRVFGLAAMITVVTILGIAIKQHTP